MLRLLLPIATIAVVSCVSVSRQPPPLAKGEKVQQPPKVKEKTMSPPKVVKKVTPPPKEEKKKAVPDEETIVSVAKLAVVKKVVVQKRGNLIFEAILQGKDKDCFRILVRVKGNADGERDYEVTICGKKYKVTPA